MQSARELRRNLVGAIDTTKAAAEMPPPTIITLDVGGRMFKTRRSTVTAESGYLRALLSDEWAQGSDPEGPHFVDADPDMFEHLLQYMRRPGVFPLFWSRASGFDYGLYSRLGHEARFFQIDSLSEWIEQERYQGGIDVHVCVSTTKGIDEMGPLQIKGNEKVNHHFLVKSRRVYICPRGIVVHRGHPEKCGAACHKAQADAEVEYEKEDYVEVASVTETIRFNGKAYDTSTKVEGERPSLLDDKLEGRDPMESLSQCPRSGLSVFAQRDSLFSLRST